MENIQSNITVTPTSRKTSSKAPKTTPVRSTLSIVKKTPKKQQNKKKKKVTGKCEQWESERTAALAHVQKHQKQAPKVDATAVKGPYVLIHVDGTSEVVNNGGKALTVSVNAKQNPDFKMPGMHSCIMNKDYNYNKADLTWICVFCKLGSHQKELGDLFGPEFINDQSDEFRRAAADDPPIVEMKKCSIIAPSHTTRMRTRSATVKQAQSALAIDIFAGMLKDNDNKYEVWYHEDCLIWSNGVHMGGAGEVVGMEAAVWSSARHRCIYCSKNGAMLACLERKCKIEAHFPCAKNAQWRLTDEFQSFCGNH